MLDVLFQKPSRFPECEKRPEWKCKRHSILRLAFWNSGRSGRREERVGEREKNRSRVCDTHVRKWVGSLSLDLFPEFQNVQNGLRSRILSGVLILDGFWILEKALSARFGTRPAPPVNLTGSLTFRVKPHAARQPGSRLPGPAPRAGQRTRREPLLEDVEPHNRASMGLSNR